MIPNGTIVVDGSTAWETLVRTRFVGRLQQRTRTAFVSAPEAHLRARLHEQAASSPVGFAIRRVTAETLGTFLDVAADFASNWPSGDAFLDRGVGFGVFQGELCVAGCSSYTLANNKLEIDVHTAPEFRRRGLARAVAATLIGYCLDHGIDPCWDAQNPESAALATQLGFSDPEPYTVFNVARHAGGD